MTLERWYSWRASRSRFTSDRRERVARAYHELLHRGIDDDDYACADVIARLSNADRLHLLWTFAPVWGEYVRACAGGDRRLAHDRVSSTELDAQLPADLTAPSGLCGDCEEGDDT